MTALLSPTNRAKGGIKWGLVGSSVALMSVATMSFVMGLWIFPVAYIDNREFPGGGLVLPGPVGYMWLRKWTTLATISDAGYQVNQWLVDGLLVSPMLIQQHRCLTSAASTAVSLLPHLRQELLGCCLTVRDVPRFLGYVLEFSAT